LWPSLHACLAFFDFPCTPRVKLYLWSLMHTSKGLLGSPICHTHVRYCTHTLLRLLGISNRSSFHQCPTECVFNFENSLEIEMFPSVSECFGNTPNIWDNDHAMIYCIWRRMVASHWLHYGVSEFLWVFGGIRSCLMFLISMLKFFWSDIWPWLYWSSCERLLFSHDVGSWTWNADDQYE
jgi:hypothetical protein